MRSQQIRKLVERHLAALEELRRLGVTLDEDGMPFVQWAEPRRVRDDSWDDISAELSALIGVKISRETVRRWYLLP